MSLLAREAAGEEPCRNGFCQNPSGCLLATFKFMQPKGYKKMALSQEVRLLACS